MASHTEIYAAIIRHLHASLGKGELEESRRVLDQLHAKKVDSPQIDALEAWFAIEKWKKAKHIAEVNPGDVLVWRRLYEASWALKREREGVSVLLDGLRFHPHDLDLRRRVISLYASAGAYEKALQHCHEAVTIDPCCPNTLQTRARLGVATESRESKRYIRELFDRCPGHWLEAHQFFLRAGFLDEAEQLLRDVASQTPGRLGPLIAQARIGLWRGDTQLADQLVHRCMESDEYRAEGWALQGMVQHFQQHPDAGLSLLRAHDLGISASSPIDPSELCCWLAVNASTQRLWDQCIRWCDAAISSSPEDYPFAYLLRIVAVCKGMPSAGTSVSSRWYSYVEQFGPMTGPLPKLWRVHIKTFFKVCRTIQHKLEGNYSNTPSWMDDGVLRLLPRMGLQRHGLRFSQQRVRVQSADELWEAFETLMVRYPNDPEVYTYSGEVLLWVGRYEEAERLFRHALKGDFVTIWTWIGLGAAMGYQGRLKEALQVFKDGVRKSSFEGPTVFVYRGEFLRRLGLLEEAKGDLLQAVQDKPQRLSAWINCVLVDFESGNSLPAELLCQSIQKHCTSLWWDACAQTQSDPLCLENLGANLEAMLTMMLGNRSSTIFTYQPPGLPLRGVQWNATNVPRPLVDMYRIEKV